MEKPKFKNLPIIRRINYRETYPEYTESFKSKYDLSRLTAYLDGNGWYNIPEYRNLNIWNSPDKPLIFFTQFSQEYEEWIAGAWEDDKLVFKTSILIIDDKKRSSLVDKIESEIRNLFIESKEEYKKEKRRDYRIIIKKLSKKSKL
jgi:hypothetical protein